VNLSADDQRRLTRASELALDWHAQQSRKGSDIPYFSHLSQVKGLVLEHGGGVDQAIAGLLHDALEDADSADERARREQTIGDEFGAAVLEIVLDCTDTGADESLEDKAPWKLRKTRYLEHLASASDASLLVAACDKRHNLHALVWDVRHQGPSYLERFNSGPAGQLWYFEGVLKLVAGRIPKRLEMELAALLAELRDLFGE